MTRRKPLPLEHYEGGVRRGVLGSETRPYSVSMTVPDPLGFEGIDDHQFNAGSVAKFKRWKQGALQVLKDVGLPIVPEDNLTARVRRQQVPFSEMREQEPLSEIMAAAELVDAINDILGDIERNVAVPINIEKLVGAYHGFAMLHLGINDDAAHGQKSAADLDAGPREAKRKADERAAIAAKILGPSPIYWHAPGDFSDREIQARRFAEGALGKGPDRQRESGQPAESPQMAKKALTQAIKLPV